MKKINITTTAAIFTVLFTGFYLTSCASTAPSEPKPEPEFNSEDEEENIEVEKIVAVHNPLPDGEIILLDSFEDGNFWQPWSDIDEKNSSSQTEVTAAWSSEGENGGVWFFEKTSRGENAVFYCDALSYRSWGNAKKILADINTTTNSSLKIHLVIETESHTFLQKVLQSALEKTRTFTLTFQIFLMNSELLQKIQTAFTAQSFRLQEDFQKEKSLLTT